MAFKHRPTSREGRQPVSSEAMAKHEEWLESSTPHHRWSRDSGQGTERNTGSLCASSRSNSWNNEEMAATEATDQDQRYEDDLVDEDVEKRGLLYTSFRSSPSSGWLDRLAIGTRTMRALMFAHVVSERSILVLGFVELATGLVTYGGVGRSTHIFNILAHFIKGGIFFWYGLLTFGRWLGCFADVGWAWNLKPPAAIVGRSKSRIPSAEFTQSFVIWFYGASNVFLEHLGAWGKEWAPMDLEHLAITIMFFGGGLLGMLIESSRLSRLLNRTLSASSILTESNSNPLWYVPASTAHSLNPLPALILMLLGIMMSHHTQHGQLAAAIHGQWGSLLVSFALTRAVTYITYFLRPPTSYLPGRPPSEVVAAFCLISGGTILMASNQDTVHALEVYNLDAMFAFTIVMGMTALTMACMAIVIAMKNWAAHRHMRQDKYGSSLRKASFAIA